MNASQSEEAIFAEALCLPPEERAAFLAEVTKDNPELREEVESLLRNHGDGEFLEEAAVAELRPTIHTASATEGPGDRIGRYKLLQQIGEGGCGVVYMAEQAEPIRRRVALKIIKLGMDTKSVIARFEAERQALAMMDHPNIAKVLDAGATDTGRPYFVMELVRGMKITEYCDEKKLPTQERLDLFMEVCNAVQHAHQKGIIHRDLKPSNVLVTVNDGVAVPKVIDFGIAKATSGQQLTDKTLFTAFEQFIGTPAYMSPEQAVLTSLDIDTRSDIYALGVLLYELMTGSTPFDAKELLEIGLDEMRRTIREEEPERPSTRVSALPGQELSTTAQHRGLEAPKLVSEIRGDLDWIVMKCLEKDRARRYETANGLALDIQRHLENEPVTACPPSRWYAFKKSARRHRFGFAATAAVFVALAIGLAIAGWMFTKERAAKLEQERLRRQAEIASAQSLHVTHFLEEALKGVGPSVARGRDTELLREILDRTAEQIEIDLQDEPEVEAHLLNVIGEVYLALGEPEKAQRNHQRALDLYVELWGRNHLDSARSLHNLGRAMAAGAQAAGAEAAFQEALDIRTRLLGENHLDVADSLARRGITTASRGDHEEAEPILRQALALRRELLPAGDVAIAESLLFLGALLRHAGESDEAADLLREALEIERSASEPDDLRIVEVLRRLGEALAQQGNLAESEEKLREVLKINRNLRGRGHPAAAASLEPLAGVLQQRGNLEAIDILFREEIAYVQGLYPAVPYWRSNGIGKLIRVLLNRHEFTKVDELINEVLTPALQAQPGNTFLRRNRAFFFARRNRLNEAVADLTEALALDPATDYCRDLAVLLVETGEFEAYQQHRRQWLASVDDVVEPERASGIAAHSLLRPASGDELIAAGRLADVAVTEGAEHGFLPYFQSTKGIAEYRRGNFTEAEKWLKNCLSHEWSNANLNGPVQLVLAMTCQHLGKDAEARAALDAGATIIRDGWPETAEGDLGAGWHNMLFARVLLREARELIEGDEQTTADPK